MKLDEMTKSMLVEEAYEAQKMAYVPYSDFCVGAALLDAIAIVGNKRGERGELCAPCGVCRQVMAEFCDPEEFKIILGAGEESSVYTLNELLPLGFTKKNLD